MKKLFLIFLILQISLFARSFLISNIPIPKTYVQNLDPYLCNEKCMQDYLDNDMIFSFLAHAKSKLNNKDQDEIRMMNVSILNLGSNIIRNKLYIALLLPYKIIGRYAASTTNATFSYLIAKNYSFKLKSYKIDSENILDIQQALTDIKNDGFSYVIAPLTQKGASAIKDINPDINIYFPTINKKDINSTSPYLFYGGIDYRAQSDLLLKKAVSPLVIFYDKSSIGNKLSDYEKEKFMNTEMINEDFLTITNELPVNVKNSQNISLDKEKRVIKFSIPKRTTNLEDQLKENENIKEGSFFINTPIVKSAMIMSQLTLYDTNATNILSTQINYDPLLLSMTQYNDRKEMLITNSITENNNVLIEANSLLGNDIVYNWINYTTTVGIDYFFNLITNENREYNINIEDNQMIYPIELLRPSLSKFIRLE